MFVLYCVTFIDCWTLTKDVHGYNGVSRDLKTLAECHAACISESTCVAIDWEPSYIGRTCWILSSTRVRNTTERGVITHYELDLTCLGESQTKCLHGTRNTAVTTGQPQQWGARSR